MVSDQNFATSITGNGTCIPVVRVEDAGLLELADFTMEILGRTALPAGTVFLVGTISHLVQVGSTLYCLDWQKMVAKMADRWPSCKVGPIPPILREDSTGTTGRCITELRHWFTTVYTGSGSVVFISSAWDSVIKGLTHTIYPMHDLDHAETSTIPLPASLRDRTLLPHKIIRTTSQAITPAFDQEVTHHILLSLVHTLCNQFGCKANPEEYRLVREPAECEVVKDSPDSPITLVLIGASHQKRTAPHLNAPGIKVIDLSHPGWSLTDQNISRVVDDISGLSPNKNTVFLIDLVSNAAFRYENQEDGSLSLSYKHEGTYHMDGRVTTCSLAQLHGLLTKAAPILDAITGLKICIPPVPRYLKTPCCDTEGHCEGIGDAEHHIDLMSKTLALRRQLKDYMVSKGISNCWVPDMAGKMFPDCNTTADIATCMCNVTSADGVHLSDEGYAKMAAALLMVVKERLASNCNIAGSKSTDRSYYWRGFNSPVGSTRPKHTPASYKEQHHGGGKWPPMRHNNMYHYSSARGRGAYNPSGGRYRN